MKGDTGEGRSRLPVLSVEDRGPDSVLVASLCAACPHSGAGCCVAPPRMDWSDLARVVHHGETDWLLAQIEAGNLVPCTRGLSLRRVKGAATPGGPRVAKCVHHDATSGCTIGHLRRPATCNYYVCESVLARAREEGAAADAERARRLQEALVEHFVRWDEALDALVRAAFPEGPRLDRTFFAWLHAQWVALDPTSTA